MPESILLKQFARCHLARVFFTDREAWARECAVLGVEPAMSDVEYGALVWGTDASVDIPLWASVCRGGEGGALLDETTLDVVRFYKRLGYAPQRLDGNPPDYIGEQFRFLEYLYAAAINGAELAHEADEFIALYALDTVKAVSEAMLGASSSPEVAALARLMEEAMLRSGAELPLPEGWLEGLESFGWIMRPPIPEGEVREIGHASFNDCGSKCHLVSRVAEGCVLSIEPNKACEEIRFTGCARGRAYRYTFLSTSRLRYPMERAGKRGEGKFRRITWERAAERIAEAMKSTRETWGPGSRYVLPGAGVCATARGDRFLRNLLSLDGGQLSFYNYYSASCAIHATNYIFGTWMCGSAPEDLRNAKLIFLWGHNPAENQFGPQLNSILMEVKARGTRIVAFDPRKSDSVLAYANEWVPLLPSTDGALIDAMCYVIWSEGLQDQDFMDRFCLGFDEAHMPAGAPEKECYRAYLFGEADGVVKDAAWGESVTGVPKETIARLAREFAAAKPACLLTGFGPQRTLNGEQTYRGFAALASITGNVGKPGGSSGCGCIRDAHGAPYLAGREDPHGVTIPSFLWTRALEDYRSLTEKDGLLGGDRLASPIKLIFSIASGMLVNQHSNINNTVRLISDEERVELIVLSDVFMTPSARYADIVLPAPSFFETENIVGPWGADDYLLWNNKAIEPLFGCRFEYDCFRLVAKYLGLEEQFTEGKPDMRAWLEEAYETLRGEYPELPELQGLIDKGYYVYCDRGRDVAFRKNVEQGVPFGTPSGKIEIFSPRLYESGLLPGNPRYTPCDEGPADPMRAKYPLQLIGFHSKRRCHSIHDQNRLLRELDPARVWINPADAKARGIADGDLAEVFNDRGTVRIPAKVTERIMPGVVAIHEGAWYKPGADGADEAGSINVLTMSDRATPLARANPQHTNLADVRRAD
ncbi:MAG: Dimethyl sulfoxide reductase DmsA precursor [Firmicutes bacterium ADurb.Bin248]|nr:MAG: Dimethyl sulfoxide reductase DmsA precursor [Firmicutes bacterium ADurb.Bin248]